MAPSATAQERISSPVPPIAVPSAATLLAFDLSSISTDATITSVALTMQMTRTSTSNAHAVSLHNLQGDWGEGASDAVGEEGVGARTEPGETRPGPTR